MAQLVNDTEAGYYYLQEQLQHQQQQLEEVQQCQENIAVDWPSFEDHKK
jgi:hypothetical protein